MRIMQRHLKLEHLVAAVLLCHCDGSFSGSPGFSSLSTVDFNDTAEVVLQNSLFAYRALVNTSKADCTSEDSLNGSCGYRNPIAVVMDTASYSFTVLPWASDSVEYTQVPDANGTESWCTEAFPGLSEDLSPVYYNSNVSWLSLIHI